MNTSATNNCKLFFAGDICISQSINSNFISGDLLNHIQSHDFSVANFEAPVIEENFKKINKAGPHIFQESTYDYLLQKKLFNVLSLANNHILDYGFEGLQKTIEVLKKYNIEFSGAGINYKEIYKPLIITKNNIRIGIIAAAEAQFGCAKSEEQQTGYAWLFSDIIVKNILDLKNKVDFILILPHAGLEMEDLPLPEWRKLYKSFIDFGADIIIASHPHVIQPKETYKGKEIYYSLGNFLFTSEHTDHRWYESLTLSCEFIKTEQGNKIIIYENFTKNENGYLDFCKPEVSDYEKSNEILNNTDLYFTTINQICKNAWENYYKNYYKFGNSEIHFNIRFQKLPRLAQKILWKFIYLFIKEANENEILLYHNISIDTHRFAVERALKNRNYIV
jgi:hypothetical protein